MNNLREGMAIPTATVEAQVFRCPSCGAPMQARSKDILAVGCVTCGAVVDTADRNYKLLSQALGMRDEKYTPRLPLGSKGTLEGKPVEVIGFLVRQSKSDGIAYDWREYLLAGENGTYRWLTEYNGHWNVVDVLSNPPTTSGIVELDNVQLWRPVVPPFLDDAGRRGDPGRRRIHLAGAARRDQPGARLRRAAADAVARIDRATN